MPAGAGAGAGGRAWRGRRLPPLRRDRWSPRDGGDSGATPGATAADHRGDCCGSSTGRREPGGGGQSAPLAGAVGGESSLVLGDGGRGAVEPPVDRRSTTSNPGAVAAG